METYWFNGNYKKVDELRLWLNYFGYNQAMKFTLSWFV